MELYPIQVTILRVIKGTKVIAIIKRMQSSDKDQTWKTDIHTKEHEATKILHTKQKANEQLDSTTKWENGPGAPVG